MATQITPTTELQAVNTMLSVIGEAPVNSITGTTTVDVSVAKNILDETSLSIQSQGWNFNTNYNYKSLSLDTNIQFIVNNELQKAMKTFKALGAASVLLNANNNYKKLIEQAKKFKAENVIIRNTNK